MTEPLIISIINHKGGVGKTSTVVNLAAGLGRLGNKVLVVDLDMQMNLTHSLIGDLKEDELCIFSMIMNDKLAVKDIIRQTPINNVELLPSGESMINLELQLHSAIGREFKLKNKLRSSELSKFDYILIDNAPHVGLATINSLIASHGYLVPVSAEYLPLVGLRHLLRTIDQIKPLHPSIQNIGYLLTMVDRREKISTDVENILRETFRQEVFETVVRVNTKFKACPQKKLSIFDVEKSQDKGFTDYANATKELIKKSERLYGIRS